MHDPVASQPRLAVVIVLNLFIILVNEWLEEQLDLVRLRVELH